MRNSLGLEGLPVGVSLWIVREDGELRVYFGGASSSNMAQPSDEAKTHPRSSQPSRPATIEMILARIVCS